MVSMTNDEVKNILYAYFFTMMGPESFRSRVIIADNQYTAADLQWLLDAIRTDPVLSSKSYLEDTFDCDDYVFYLKTKVSLFSSSQRSPAPQAVGFLLTMQHAFNLCIDAESQVWLINTQSEQRNTTSAKEDFSRFLSFDQDSNPIQLIYI
jgi:hypothetical protein